MNGISESRLRTALAWAVILLTAGPVGIAVVLGLAFGESPCILCWAQRVSMVLMALAGLFVLRYGPRPRYLGTVVLLGAWGTFMAIRHSSLHLARDVGQGFAASFFGAHTYVWSWVVHFTVLVVLAVLLILLREDSVEKGPHEMKGPARLALGLFFVVVVANAVQAFVSTGPPPFMGQGDPIRVSWNPKHWVWTFRGELRGPITLRGSWDIPKPAPASVDADADPAAGPLGALPALEVKGWEQVKAPLRGTLTDLARDPATGRFLAVTDEHAVYVLDAALSTVEHHVLLDHGFSVDIQKPAGAAFLGDTLVVGTINKSYLLIRPDPEADEDYEWRHFFETSGGMSELRRSRFSTVRARQMYVSSLAFDPGAREFLTVSVPAPRHRRMVVSTFDAADFMLASEFLPRVGPGLALGEKRMLAEYVVTGAVVEDGRLYAISAAYSTLLVVDLAAKTVVEAYGVPGLAQPVGIASRDGDLLIAQADGRIAVVVRPGAATAEPVTAEGTAADTVASPRAGPGA
ncbi:MAG: disulfide bond formation protein B [Gemmatimonadetes bacterium]|nr:disulfide bond formation protein B [Gemmatimonadota bacterium]